MAHASGLAGWDPPFGTAELYDRALAIRRLAAQAPWWEPGATTGYHAHTQGLLVDELVMRVAGVRLRHFVATDIEQGLGADVRIGARHVDPPRIAEIIPPTAPVDRTALGPFARPTFTDPRLDAAAANTAAWRNAELGASNGHGNARAVVRALAPLASGNGRLLGARTAELAFTERITVRRDAVLGIPVRWSFGFALPHAETMPALPNGRRCFWGGWGGSIVLVDPDHRLTMAYTMNRMSAGILGSPRSDAYLHAVLAASDSAGAG
jgi:CubicO group peptidase (beta-lactamase class C family)